MEPTNRIGYLGSSDAKMVAKIGRNGQLNEADKYRIAVMLGLELQKTFTSFEASYGNEIEAEVFEHLKQTYPQAVSNQYYESERLSRLNGFKIANHIDYEIIKDGQLIWIEHKTTKAPFLETFSDYNDQLAWHMMLLTEKASELNLKPILMLSHYQVTDYGVFNPANLHVEKVVAYNEHLHKGLSLIAEAVENFTYEPKMELEATYLPEPVQEKIKAMAEIIQKIETMQAEIETFKQKMLESMEANGIKSIKNDAFNITYVAPSTSTTFDKKKFEVEHPELANKYNKQSERKSFVKISLK